MAGELWTQGRRVLESVISGWKSGRAISQQCLREPNSRLGAHEYPLEVVLEPPEVYRSTYVLTMNILETIFGM